MTSITQRLDDGLSQLQSMISEIRAKFKDLNSNIQTQRDQAESLLTELLSRLDRKLKSMENDVRSVPSNSREYYESEIGDGRNEYDHFQSELTKFKNIKNNPDAMAAMRAERNRQLTQGISSSLDQALSFGNDTIQAQNSITNTLLDDRQHIENINNNLDIIDTQALDAKARTRRIAKRICCNAVFVWILVVLLLGVLAFTLWYKLH